MSASSTLFESPASVRARGGGPADAFTVTVAAASPSPLRGSGGFAIPAVALAGAGRDRPADRRASPGDSGTSGAFSRRHKDLRPAI
jgi:hypothetical protein